MTQKYFILIFSVLLIAFTSCVSKKYVEMEAGRLKAEKLSQQLNDENNAKAIRIEVLIADFESMKNELLENNAIKDHYIDSLNSEISILTKNLNKEQESLQKTSFNLDFEKQRLSDALNSSEKSIKILQTKVEQLETEVSNINSVVDQKNFEIGLKNDQAKVMEGKIQAGNNKLTLLQTELDKVKVETGKLKAQIKEKETTILKLENNVKLLKRKSVIKLYFY